MRQDTAIGVIVALVLLSIVALLWQYMNTSYDFDFYSGGSEYVMGMYACGESQDSVRDKNLFEAGKRIAVAAGASQNSDRKDLLSWRTRRNMQMKRRPKATDSAPFDALRPAYDAMCRAVEQQETIGECFRQISPPAAASLAAKLDGKVKGAAGAAAGVAAAAGNEGKDMSRFPKWAPALRRQMRLWSPPTSAFLQRPTLLCVTMVDVDEPRRVEQALLQWKLWGQHCDDFYVAVQLPALDSTKVHNGTVDRIALRGKYQNQFRDANLPLTHLWAVRPLVSWKILDYVKADRWQAFRELSRVMGEEDLSAPVYQAEYTLFVRDDTYVVPENVFAFLSSPEVRHLENIGVPVIMGHVLQVPPPGEEEAAEAAAAGGEIIMGAEEAPIAAAAGNGGGDDDHQQAPKARVEGNGGKTNNNGGDDKKKGGEPDIERRLFASIDGGLLWNRVTRKLFMNAIRSQDACAYANTEADDVQLSDCFRFYGISPTDTADQRGSDRQHILSPEWAMKVGYDPRSLEWYSLFRGRPSLKGADAISPTSMTFGGLKSIEEMQQLHDILSEK